MVASSATDKMGSCNGDTVEQLLHLHSGLHRGNSALEPICIHSYFGLAFPMKQFAVTTGSKYDTAPKSPCVSPQVTYMEREDKAWMNETVL